MIHKIKLLFSHQLISGGLIVLIGGTIANVGSYAFHLITGRFIPPQDYSVLETLFSLIYFISIPLGVVGVIIVRNVSQDKNPLRLTRIVKALLNKLSVLGLLAFIIFLSFYPLLSKFLNIHNFYYFLAVGVILGISFVSITFSSVLQGLLRFRDTSILGIIGSWSKPVIALILLLLGFGLGGVIFSLTAGSVIAVAFGYWFLRRQVDLKQKTPVFLDKNIISRYKHYALAILVSHTSLIAFFSIDMILARRFLLPVESGWYASLSVLGRIIYFASNAIVSVMFPVIAERQAKGQKYNKIFWSGLGIMLLVSCGISVIYFWQPKLMITTLYGTSYSAASVYLPLFAVFFALYSLNAYFVTYYLAISRKLPVYFSLVAVIIQTISIYLFGRSISQIVMINIYVSLGLLISLLGYNIFTNSNFKTHSNLRLNILRKQIHKSMIKFKV